MKKLLTFFICTIVLMCPTNTITSNAKVLEPVIVHTESWVANYYIDDDIETLYPYWSCEADIYSDGTVGLRIWNNHEWTGYSTITHYLNSPYTKPYNEGSLEYSLVTGCSYLDTHDKTMFADKFPNIEGSYIPKNYIEGCTTPVEYRIICSRINSGGRYIGPIEGYYELLSYDVPTRPNNYNFVYTPTKEVTASCAFCLFGHILIISPEMFTNQTPTSQVSEQEQYILSLEEENAELKEENARLTTITSSDSILCLDTDGNSIIDAKDATTILKIYAINSTGGNIQTLDDLKNYN